MVNMIKILFVCHGNICRSPMAEFVMKDYVEKAGLSNLFYIESAATSSEEIYMGVGNAVYPPAKAELARHGISCDGKRARKVETKDFERFDMVIAMDDRNFENLKRNFPGNEEKLSLLMEYTGERRSIADPWYTRDFESTFNDVSKACKGLLEYILKNDC